MGAYIDREEAIKCLDGSVLITRQSEAEAVREYFEMVAKRLESVPAVDLVKCGECKHFHYDKPYIIQGIPVLGHEVCDFWGDGCKTNLNGFCSYGERRADEID